jgi:hypothetical protein
MAKRDPERTRKIRIAVRYLLDHGCLHKGNQSRLAEHFQVSRQRVHQIVVEERRRDLYAGRALPALRTIAPELTGSAGIPQHAQGA